MRIAVCDDNEIDREIVCTLLQRVFEEDSVQPAPALEAYENGLVLLDDIRDGDWFYIILLDIYMQDHLGIDVARKLREAHYTGAIIFLTASSDFAIDGYDVEAAGYILKPATVERLSEVLTRVIRAIEERSYPVRRRNAMHRVPLREILYIESVNNRCILHRQNGESYNIYKRLDEIESELSDPRFLRCSQSFIVNMDYIIKVDRSFYLTTGDIVLIRQRSLKSIQQAYYDYLASNRPEGAKVPLKTSNK